MENNEIYEKLLKKYTLNKQYVVAIEELAELQKELTKALRSKGDIEHTAEEIADVEIMLEQLKYYNRENQLSQKVEYWKYKKIKRIKEIVGIYDEN